jgi:WbqC-like protein family
MSEILVVSQPMFLPWIGLFEQVRLADVFIHYDDVQLPQGRSFTSRVQIKAPNGVSWLTAPIERDRSRKLLNQVILFEKGDWRSKHLRTIRHAYAQAPYFDLMFQIVEEIYHHETDRLSDFNINAVERIARWLGLAPRFMRSSTTGVAGAATQRLVDLCIHTNCTRYVTGHGGLKYLDHERFEDAGISVRYMNYRKVPYQQGDTAFTPYVSILDPIAHCGERARDLLRSESVDWKDFVTNGT